MARLALRAAHVERLALSELGQLVGGAAEVCKVVAAAISRRVGLELLAVEAERLSYLGRVEAVDGLAEAPDRRMELLLCIYNIRKQLLQLIRVFN